jgi:hypothetical protein
MSDDSRRRVFAAAFAGAAIVEGAQQPLMDSAKAAIRHDEHEIARAMFVDDDIDDFVDRFRRSCGPALMTKVVHKSRNGEALVFRQCRPEHRSE